MRHFVAKCYLESQLLLKTHLYIHITHTYTIHIVPYTKTHETFLDI